MAQSWAGTMIKRREVRRSSPHALTLDRAVAWQRNGIHRVYRCQQSIQRQVLVARFAARYTQAKRVAAQNAARRGRAAGVSTPGPVLDVSQRLIARCGSANSQF